MSANTKSPAAPKLTPARNGAPEAPAPSAPPAELAPVPAPVVTGYASGKAALESAIAGRNFTRPADLFDAVAAFALAFGHPFVPARSFRDNVLRIIGESKATGKGKATGTGARWSMGFTFGDALSAYVKAAKDSDAAAYRREEVRSFRDAGRMFTAFGGVSFEVERDNA